MQVTKDIQFVGVNDHAIDLFEGQYPVKNGMSYNSYLIRDEKIAVLDTVDARFAGPWLENVEKALAGRQPDYLIIQHMEPDHSANVALFLEKYPAATAVATAKAFAMIQQFFGMDFAQRRMVVAQGDTLSLGRHTLAFIPAPMVHWPEVMVTYDRADKVLFSADAFGKFGALDRAEPWTEEARRYYFGIVGKYGIPVQALLKKAADLEIQMICPLHGPALTENLEEALGLYKIWSAYEAESRGAVIAYTSIYGHTKAAVALLAQRLKEKGCPVTVYDLCRCDLSQAVADAFRYHTLVLATTTYNGEIFPFMEQFLHHLTERGYRDRTIGLMENGSWAPMAAKVMGLRLAECKNLAYLPTTVRIRSALQAESIAQVEALADEIKSRI